MSGRIKEVKAALQDRLDALVKDLQIEGSWRGNVFSGKSPVRQDRKAGSFVIWRSPNVRGGFKDYADDDVRGDILDLICLCKGLGKDRKAGLAWAEDWLGWKQMSRTDKAKFMRDVKRRPARRKKIWRPCGGRWTGHGGPGPPASPSMEPWVKFISPIAGCRSIRSKTG